MERNFGKYDVPPTLQILIDLEKTLGEEEHFFYGFNFYLSLSNFRYFNTPSDVIVFGAGGTDGIHYGFLTDYGSAVELNATDSGLFYNYFANEESYLETKKQWDELRGRPPYQQSEQELSARK